MPDIMRTQKSGDTGASFTAVNPFAGAGAQRYPVSKYGGVRIKQDDDDTVDWFGYYMHHNTTPLYYHLRQTINGGGVWANVEAGLGLANADIVTSLRINPDNPQNIVLFVRRSAENDDLWRSVNHLIAAAGYTEIDAAMDFEPADLYRDQDNPKLVFVTGNRAAEAVLVQRTMNEAANWTDLTGNLDDDTGDAITRIVKPRRI